MKRPWKPHYPKNTGPLPERWMSERGQARDILAAWEYNKDLDQDAQLAGCDQHLFIPDLIPGEQINSGPDWVEYKMGDGSVWIDTSK